MGNSLLKGKEGGELKAVGDLNFENSQIILHFKNGLIHIINNFRFVVLVTSSLTTHSVILRSVEGYVYSRCMGPTSTVPINLSEVTPVEVASTNETSFITLLSCDYVDRWIVGVKTVLFHGHNAPNKKGSMKLHRVFVVGFIR